MSDHKLGRKIMVVEDEPDILNIVGEALESRGYIVDLFSDPLKALEEYRRNPKYSLVISDIRMPKMSGMELVRYIHEISPDVSFLLMTAYEKDNEILKILPMIKTGEIIQKPFGLKILYEMVEKKLKTRFS